MDEEHGIEMDLFQDHGFSMLEIPGSDVIDHRTFEPLPLWRPAKRLCAVAKL